MNENNNHGNQSGDGSINVGNGDFRGAKLNINNSNNKLFTIDELNITRHPSLGGFTAKIESINVFGLITGVASLIGLYLTLFPLGGVKTYASWSGLFLFLLALSIISILLSVSLKRKKFENFLSRKIYAELDSSNKVHFNRIRAICPFCQTKMNLYTVGAKGGPYKDMLICERNPSQHRVLLDPTLLPEID
ncbi:hypothetical protein [Comamonas aquatica]|uniref:hypothetical protein n=1 Tax=Comamonas aquatica TaxID=225991 RepID=UPI0012DD2BC6|nr:hypothetical protein [Comamonas aquatica]